MGSKCVMSVYMLGIEVMSFSLYFDTCTVAVSRGGSGDLDIQRNCPTLTEATRTTSPSSLSNTTLPYRKLHIHNIP